MKLTNLSSTNEILEELKNRALNQGKTLIVISEPDADDLEHADKFLLIECGFRSRILALITGYILYYLSPSERETLAKELRKC